MSSDQDMVQNLFVFEGHAFCPLCHSADVDQEVHRPENQPIWGRVTCQSCGHSTAFRHAGSYINTTEHL